MGNEIMAATTILITLNITYVVLKLIFLIADRNQMKKTKGPIKAHEERDATIMKTKKLINLREFIYLNLLTMPVAVIVIVADNIGELNGLKVLLLSFLTGCWIAAFGVFIWYNKGKFYK